MSNREKVLGVINYYTDLIKSVVVINNEGGYGDGELAVSTIARMIKFDFDVDVYIMDIQEMIHQKLHERGVNPNQYWHGNKPILSIFKEILKPILKQYNISDPNCLSKILSAVGKHYITTSTTRMYLLHPDALDVVNINDGKSCFRKGGCNREHYMFLKRLNDIDQASKFEYILTDTGEDVARLLCIHNDTTAMVFNCYSGTYTLEVLKEILLKGLNKIWGYNTSKIVSVDTPFYLNGNKCLALYKDTEDGDSATVKVKNLLKSTKSKCFLCNDIVHIGEAYSVSREGQGVIICRECGEEKYGVCHDCGTIVEDEYWLHGNLYCESCFHEVATYCEHGGEAILLEEAYEAFGAYYCIDCFKSLFAVCHECDGIIRQDEAQYVNEDPYCNECFTDKFTICSYCNKAISVDKAVYIEDKPFCKDCADKHAVCSKCGEIYKKKIMTHYENTGYVCIYCDTVIVELNHKPMEVENA